MKLEKVIIENFRSYQERIEVKMEDLTAFIGKNDIGKSTILEALEIFFNNKTVKIDSTDACVHGDNKNVRIGCVFSKYPDQLIIDATANTTLEQEFILNNSGLLEIHKIFDCSKKNPSEEIYTVADHPIYDGFLLELTQAKLKQKVRELEVSEDEVDLRSNVSMRHAIYRKMLDQDFDIGTREIPLKKSDAKSVWEKLRNYLPIYSLFQADRPSVDGDSEVQDPMKLAVNEALESQQSKLDEIKYEVEKKALEVATSTVEKLKEMNEELAKQLVPHFSEEPNWNKIFKLALNGDDEIPVNKRGSGVRRLILLNFFRAEAERKQQSLESRPVIYAIEEPETAQHPDNQSMLAQAFLTLSNESESQVILTTHVPAFAGLLPTESIRYIKNLPAKHVVNGRDNDEVLSEVANALGVLPSTNRLVRMLVFVEGIHDVEAIKAFSNIVSRQHSKLLDLSETEEVAVLPSGGSTLKGWVEKRYLENLRLPEFHIYDRDMQNPPKYQEFVDEINGRDNCYAYLTNKREMENYIHADVIEGIYGIKIETEDDADIPSLVAREIHSRNSPKPWDEVSPDKKKNKESTVKRRLNNEAIQLMTYEQLCEIDLLMEVEGWMKEITTICKETVHTEYSSIKS